MSGSVIVAGARTPIGRLLGGLKDLSAADLGGVAIKGALEKAGVSGDQVDYVIMGQVIQAGAGQNPARSAGVARRHPDVASRRSRSTRSASPASTRSRMADQLIRAGEDEIVVAGGMESMTNAPHLLPKSREGFKYGDVTLVDSMAYDALYDQATQQAMGALTEELQRRAHTSLTREEQDAFAAALAPEGRRGLEERRLRRRGRARSRSRSARATRSSSRRTRASAATPPPSRWPSCARRSARTARSPPARPRRSPTAPARSW